MMNRKGVALLQVWLMIFGFVGIVFGIGMVSGEVALADIFQQSYIDKLKGNPDLVNEEITKLEQYGSGYDEYIEQLKSLGGANPMSSLSTAVSAAPIVADYASDFGGGPNSGVLSEEAKKLLGTGGTNAVAGAATKNTDSWISNFFETTKGSGPSALLSGLQWATVAYLGGQLVGGLFGFSDDNTAALSTALAAGFGVYKGLSIWSTTASGTGFMSPAVIGLGVGVVIFALMYKTTETKIVTFDCMPWQAPNGGNSCEVCNDENLPCSEYRCRALGQGCEIVNEGTAEEKCVYVNPKDVNPPIISPNYDKLSVGYEYKNVKNSPPGPGFNIVNVGTKEGCLTAFTPLEFGLTTDEPAQCKIDFNHTESFDDMAVFVGGSNLYGYNHSEMFSLPGASDFEGSGFELENGKDLTFFVRCKDKNGNTNVAEYAVNFCVDPSPDSTAPKIEATSIVNAGCVAENVDSAEVVFYTNEPADCRWSFMDQDYDLMINNMACSNKFSQVNAAQLFSCYSKLTGIARDGASYYVRCKDQPGAEEIDRNKNSESFEFRLRGSTGLVLKNLQPNETIFGGVSPIPVELYAETLFGCNEGLAICSYSDDGNNYIEFFDTNNQDGIHTQRLDLVGGNYKYFVKCVDAGGNVVEDSVNFNLDIDTNPPVIARVYEEGQMLKVVTVRDSECSYGLDNCDFSFAEGTEMPYGNTTIHVAEWDEKKTYYIKCRDEFLNEAAGCSIIVRPSTNFL
ncbi:MAG: hypothetical protein V1888_02675 [archaeon]